MIHTVKGFGIVDKAEIDVFLELSCFFDDPVQPKISCSSEACCRKGRETGDQIANIRWIIEKAREFQKNIYFCFIDYAKAFDCVDHNKLWKILKRWEYQTTWPASWEICVQVRKQQLELDMEQQTGSK